MKRICDFKIKITKGSGQLIDIYGFFKNPYEYRNCYVIINGDNRAEIA